MQRNRDLPRGYPVDKFLAWAVALAFPHTQSACKANLPARSAIVTPFGGCLAIQAVGDAVLAGIPNLLLSMVDDVFTCPKFSKQSSAATQNA